jgi:hypothetical protein
MKIPILIFVLSFTLSILGQQKMSEKELDGLKGKVKSVTTVRDIIESKNYANNTLKKLRDKVELYDENGAPTESVDNEYNYKYVYTFVDGNLTSKMFQIVKKETLKLATSDSEIRSKEKKTEDERYDLKYKYKFDDKKRIIEQNVISNTNELFNRIVYKYNEKGLLVEELRYSNGTVLNDQYFYKYDANDNLIEMKKVLHRPEKNIISIAKYSNYKIDSQGNWIERTETDIGEFRGKELKKVIKYFRKIEYYK